jgi:hypothetical protein
MDDTSRGVHRHEAKATKVSTVSYSLPCEAPTTIAKEGDKRFRASLSVPKVCYGVLISAVLTVNPSDSPLSARPRANYIRATLVRGCSLS